MKDLNDGNFGNKYLMVDKFSKLTYINDKKFFLKSDLYIEPEYYITIFDYLHLLLLIQILSWGFKIINA